MDIEAFRKAGYEAIDRICDYYNTLESRPVLAQVEPGYLINKLSTHPPQEGEDIQEITADFQRLIMPGITHWNHPEFFAFFPSGSSLAGILADLYSTSVSNPGFNWICSPACTELEQVVVDWVANLLSLSPAFLNSPPAPVHDQPPSTTASSPSASPPLTPVESSGTSQPLLGGGGSIQSTASESVLVAIIAARHHFLSYFSSHSSLPPPSHESLIIYLSTQTHSLGLKGAKLLGLNYRELDVDEGCEWGVKGLAFKNAYDEDRNKGLWPFIFIGTIGTTSSGANDHIDEIGPIISQLDSVWFHIDAAWAGVSFSCPEFRRKGKLDAINKYADSFCTNFHKWGLVNFDCSILWVRDRAALTASMDIGSSTPSFLRTTQSDAGLVVDYRNWQLSLGRRFRSIKLWFVLRNFGVKGFRAHIRKGVGLAELFERLLKGEEAVEAVCEWKMKRENMFEMVTPRALALVVFRLIPPRPSPPESHNALSQETLNALNITLHQNLTHPPTPPPLASSFIPGSDPSVSNALFITRTELKGKVCLRMAIGAERTTEVHIRKAVKILERVGRRVLREAGFAVGEGDLGACAAETKSAQTE
ncbi:pyridoxal phosphate-dependent transferase [Cantharellus anzutake]|uniref:pyridoxal phosphate-dependent transferase n=1 Tax=Cantharellus anzutake TaxID=1750568 RepID=UPI00190385B0|nr:pyridoxal phosphate-dependent transferase [Cantharellus anzutake]KAF8316499.1 pyridoxal phosphate-dependent transferase [Cantharellus anzutake]